MSKPVEKAAFQRSLAALLRAEAFLVADARGEITPKAAEQLSSLSGVRELALELHAKDGSAPAEAVAAAVLRRAGKTLGKLGSTLTKEGVDKLDVSVEFSLPASRAYELIVGGAESILTVETFARLSRNEQCDIVNDRTTYGNIMALEADGVAGFVTPKLRAMAEKLATQAAATMPDFDDQSYATIGGPRLAQITLVVGWAGEIFGGTVTYRQEGCLMPDGSTPHFDNMALAEAAGGEEHDINWAWTASFDGDGKLLDEEAQWEWTGC